MAFQRVVHLQARSQNCGKRLLASTCLSVCLSAWKESVSTGRILLKILYLSI
jgi:hypothetical protein